MEEKILINMKNEIVDLTTSHNTGFIAMPRNLRIRSGCAAYADGTARSPKRWTT
jgi:hypothetical protein